MDEQEAGTEPIPDEEFVLRRIPPGQPWISEGLQPTPANFKPRSHLREVGISVSRESLTSAHKLLATLPAEIKDRLGRGDQWYVARASVRDIRRLGLDVISDPTHEDPGHAQIVDASSSLAERRVRHALTAVFSIQDAQT